MTSLHVDYPHFSDLLATDGLWLAYWTVQDSMVGFSTSFFPHCSHLWSFSRVEYFTFHTWILAEHAAFVVVNEPKEVTISFEKHLHLLGLKSARARKRPKMFSLLTHFELWLQNISSILRHDVQILSLTNSKILTFCFTCAVYNWFMATVTILSSLETGTQFDKGMDCICMICWHKHFHWFWQLCCH